MSVTKISLHFEDERGQAPLGFLRLPAQELASDRVQTGRRLAGPDGPENRHAGKESTLRDRQPFRVPAGPVGAPDLNNILEQDHRAIKRRVTAKQSFHEFHAARRTIQGYEAMHMIRKGQARWVSGSDVRQQIQFINTLFEVAA